MIRVPAGLQPIYMRPQTCLDHNICEQKAYMRTAAIIGLLCRSAVLRQRPDLWTFEIAGEDNEEVFRWRRPMSSWISPRSFDLPQCEAGAISTRRVEEQFK